MNEYIDKLIQDDKLSLSVDKSKTFGFQLGDKWVGKDKVIISGPCSIESRDMLVGWVEELTDIGIDAFRESTIWIFCPVPRSIDSAACKAEL